MVRTNLHRTVAALSEKVIKLEPEITTIGARYDEQDAEE